MLIAQNKTSYALYLGIEEFSSAGFGYKKITLF